jgi:hypothetical protein
LHKSKSDKNKKINKKLVFFLIFLIIVIISLLLIVNSKKQYHTLSHSLSNNIKENHYALVPDRIVYKNGIDEYYILTESDKNFNEIYSIIVNNLNYTNNGNILSFDEIENLKNNYRYLEFDYNTKSKNKIFFFDNPDIAMISMTGEQGQISRKTIPNLEKTALKIELKIKDLEQITKINNNFEYEITINTLPDFMNNISEKLPGVRYKLLTEDEFKQLQNEYNIQLEKIDFENQNVIATIYNRDKINKIQKCIGHLSFYFSNNYSTNKLNIQIISKIYNSNCIYCYEDYTNLNNTSDSNINNNYNYQPEDITDKFLSSKYYGNGTIIDITNNIIRFRTLEKEYTITNNENILYIDGRTIEKMNFEDIKVGYYLDFTTNGIIYVYKNITGNELKKELLRNLSIEDNNIKWIYPSIELVYIEKTGDNEGIVSIRIFDFIDSNNYYNATNESFLVNVKFTKDTIYHSKGGNIFNIDTLNYAMYNINDLRLDPSTLNDEYPIVLEFNSTDS